MPPFRCAIKSATAGALPAWRIDAFCKGTAEHGETDPAAIHGEPRQKGFALGYVHAPALLPCRDARMPYRNLASRLFEVVEAAEESDVASGGHFVLRSDEPRDWGASELLRCRYRVETSRAMCTDTMPPTIGPGRTMATWDDEVVEASRPQPRQHAHLRTAFGRAGPRSTPSSTIARHPSTSIGWRHDRRAVACRGRRLCAKDAPTDLIAWQRLAPQRVSHDWLHFQGFRVQRLWATGRTSSIC